MTVLTIRAHKRYAVRQMVTLHRQDRTSLDGLMIELSSEGFRISNLGRPGLTVGEPVTVEFEELTFNGRIRWSHDGIAGVRLDKALFSNEVNELIVRGRGATQSDVRRYGT